MGGSIEGERPQAILALLLPDVPEDKLATGGKGKLTFALNGIPATNLAGRVALETQAMTIGFSDQVTRLFGSNQPLLAAGRNLGLLGLDLLPPAKSWFARQAMGLGTRPDPRGQA